MEDSGINWIQLFLNLIGGLALFLFGMDGLTGSLRAAAGRQMKNFLARATGNRFYALFSGAVVTAAVQSSSITTVLLVGFGSVGLLSLTNSAGIILGANVGSTVTAQIIAFNVTQWGLLLVVFGIGLRYFRKHERLRHCGGLLLGLGLIFFGMDLMSDATRPLRDYPPFVDLMAQMENPLFGILCGFLFTAVVQSSAATTGLTIILVTEGLLGLDGAVAIVLGANVGTCVTALLATVGQPRQALRVALIHVFFNVGGVILWLPFIPFLVDISWWMMGQDGSGAVSGAEYGRAVANAHTAFNLVNAVVFLGLIRFLVAAVEKMVPPSEKKKRLNPLLDDYYLKEPETALNQVRAEAVDFLKSVSELHRKLSEAIIRNDEGTVRDFDGADDEIDERQADFLRYLGRLAERELTSGQQKDLNAFIGIINQIENLGDMLDHVYQGLGEDLVSMEKRMSKETCQLLDDLLEKVQSVFSDMVSALENSSKESVEKVFSSEREVRRAVREAKDSLASRLANRDDDRLRMFRIEVDLIECQARIAHILSEIGREIQV